MKFTRARHSLLLLALTAMLPMAAAAQQNDARENPSDRRSERQQTAPRQERQRGERRQATVEGTVIRTKKVDLRGSDLQHLVVLIKRKEGKLAVVDMGPVKKLSDAKVRTGDQLVVVGEVIAVGERKALMAREIKKDGSSLVVDRRASRRQQNRSSQ